MKVIVSDFTQEQIAITSEHIEEAFGRKSKKRFRQRIRHIIGLLRKHPNLGPTEPLLAHRAKLYRSIVITSLNKMVYTIQEDTIIIANIWDTRRDPSTLANDIDRSGSRE